MFLYVHLCDVPITHMQFFECSKLFKGGGRISHEGNIAITVINVLNDTHTENDGTTAFEDDEYSDLKIVLCARGLQTFCYCGPPEIPKFTCVYVQEKKLICLYDGEA